MLTAHRGFLRSAAKYGCGTAIAGRALATNNSRRGRGAASGMGDGGALMSKFKSDGGRGTWVLCAAGAVGC